LARKLGPQRLSRIANGQRARAALESLDQHSERRGFVVVVLVRWFPLAPFNLMNYLLGFTRVRARDYLWATALACAPTTLLCVYAGAIVPGPTAAAAAQSTPLMSAALIVLGMTSVLGLSYLARNALLGSEQTA
jgi:uncharacterized membrane protein YdjX (TVP38/TMEM64 family)